MIQPPRGFGENPIAIYHDPDMPPSHHYLAAYRWLENSFGADAVVHLGKHGTLEWLPGKGLGLCGGCAPDAVLGDLPLVYPFIVNDPGEGTQAKRRGHATVVDHLVPPMARADTYGDLAKLEQLLDEYALVQRPGPDEGCRPSARRSGRWSRRPSSTTTCTWTSQPDEDDFDEFVLHIDGYLCEIKDVQIRDGLHILGGGPVGEAAGQPGARPCCAPRRSGAGGRARCRGCGRRSRPRSGWTRRSCWPSRARRWRSPVELSDLVDGPARTAADAIDLLEQLCRRLAEGMEARAGPVVEAVPLVRDVVGAELPEARRGAGVRLPTRSCRGSPARPTRSATSCTALDGGYVPAGPSGSPTRGLVNVLPTGRNFYSVDPKAIPSRLSLGGRAVRSPTRCVQRLPAGHRRVPEVGRADGLGHVGDAHRRATTSPRSWRCWAVRPVWDEASRRVTGFEVVPLRGARPAAHRRHGAHLRLLPRRLPARGRG